MVRYNIAVVFPPGLVFARSFDELAEGLMWGLRDLGYEARITRDGYQAGWRNVIIGVHLLDERCMGNLPDDSIVLNTEQLAFDIVHNTQGSWRKRIFAWCKRFETWDYSDKNIEKLKENGINAKRYIIGYHPKLDRIPQVADPPIDVLFYGCMNERRERKLLEIQKSGLNLQVLCRVFGDRRDAYIANSKVVLNIHYYDSKIFETVRVAYLLNNHKAVVAEVDPDTVVDGLYMRGVCAMDYDGILDACRKLVNDADLRRQTAERGFETLRGLPQAEMLRPLLEA